jgi:hypothetical protein
MTEADVVSQQLLNFLLQVLQLLGLLLLMILVLLVLVVVRVLLVELGALVVVLWRCSLLP